MSEQIHSRLMEWYNKEGRRFPWRTSSSEFEIFVAEFLLRKTRAETVAKHFPSIMRLASSFRELAGTSPSKLRKALKPLGLHERANWLVEGAKRIQESHGGCLPRDPEGLLSLKGVGEYTKDALLCFVFGEPLIPVDTNVRRIGSRLRNRDLDDEEVKTLLDQEAPQSNVKAFVFALIDLGSKVCRAESPKCEECPLASVCEFRGD